MSHLLLAALVGLLSLVSHADAKPSGVGLLRVLTPASKGTVSAHPQVNVLIEFGTTADGAVPDPTTFRARLNGTDITDRFTPLADGEIPGVSGLRAALDESVVRLGASNRLRLRVRSAPLTTGTMRRVKDRARIRFSVEAHPNQPPQVHASADSDILIPSMPIRFDASASSDAELDPLTWTWDFGDGAAASGPVVEHVYATGTGDVVVTVTVSDGAASTTKTLPLAAEPPVDPDRTKGVLAISADGPLEFGGVPVGQHVTRTLTVTNADGTPTSQLLVRASSSTADFTVEPATLDLGPNASGTLTVGFAPQLAGHAETVVSLVASASNRSALSLLGHGFGGAAAGSGPTLAARPVFYTAPHPTLPGAGIFAIRPDGSRFFADNTVHGCVVPGGGAGTDDACLTNADCAAFGGTCDASVSSLLDPQDLCADPEGNLVVLSVDGAVTDPNPNALTDLSAALLRISLDASGAPVAKELIARVTGDTLFVACDDLSLAEHGQVYVPEYFDVDDNNCDRTEREALTAIRKDGGGSNVLKARLDSIEGIDGCNDLEDSSAGLATAGAGDPLYVAFDQGGIWRFDPRNGHRPIVTGIASSDDLDVHPDGSLMFALTSELGTRTVVNLYKVSPSRVTAGPLAFAALTPCASHALPNNGGHLFVGSLAVQASAADASTAIALVGLQASLDARGDVLPAGLAPQGTVAFTVPSGSADTCATTGLITLDPLDLLSF